MRFLLALTGLIAMTKTVAREYSGRGITANSIAPGFIESGEATPPPPPPPPPPGSVCIRVPPFWLRPAGYACSAALRGRLWVLQAARGCVLGSD
jgi:NAD(P)-dependent dehydrogenase (short-subunit alcohol dehydrogenase family)